MRVSVLFLLASVLALGCAARQPQSSTGMNFVPSMSAGLETNAVSAQPTTVQPTRVMDFNSELPAHLSAEEVSAEVKWYWPDIEACYLKKIGDVRRAGTLKLTFVIGRDGSAVSLDVIAPGLPVKTVRQMATCIREAVNTIHFPERRFDTTAMVPYYFQRTNAPGTGPQESCWNPKGCPGQ